MVVMMVMMMVVVTVVMVVMMMVEKARLTGVGVPVGRHRAVAAASTGG